MATTAGTTQKTNSPDPPKSEEQIICFAPNTVIATPKGEVPVEDLRAGDRVFTRDNGLQVIHWTGFRDLTAEDLAERPEFHPVLIQAGTLGANMPEQDLLVSPNHRILLTGEKANIYFGETEVMAAAKHLIREPGIDQVEAHGIRYHHILFERHEILLSGGAWTESFQPTDYSLRGVGSEQRGEIEYLFPDLAQKSFSAVRRVLKRHEARLLLH